jgi:hypothetical protein
VNSGAGGICASRSFVWSAGRQLVIYRFGPVGLNWLAMEEPREYYSLVVALCVVAFLDVHLLVNNKYIGIFHLMAV